MSTPPSPHAVRPPLSIDIVSDVVCPWCFIGKRRLEKALAMRPDIDIELRWRAYFLNPWIPRAGIDRASYLETKFGSVERYRAIAQRVVVAAEAEGLHYALDKISRQPNTLDCHRLILWAGTTGAAGPVKQRLMELYFSAGADLTDPEVLVAAAVDCGMDGQRVRQLLATNADEERVKREADAAKDAGIDGVPYFIFGNVLAVAGAQDPSYLADALGRASVEYARRNQSEPARAPSD
jgi:predicted DsbA family dithiol-disulfide isomerase